MDAVLIASVVKSQNVDVARDPIDYFDIDPELGTMKDFELLVEKLHEKSKEMSSLILVSLSLGLLSFNFPSRCLFYGNLYRTLMFSVYIGDICNKGKWFPYFPLTTKVYL